MMKSKLWIPALLVAATFSATAFARGGDYDRGGPDRRYDQGQYERHDHWRHDNRHDWRYDHRPPPAYRYGYEYREAPRHYEQPAVYLPLPPLPPPPHEVLRDILRGHR
jgi:hypothetical protein